MAKKSRYDEWADMKALDFFYRQTPRQQQRLRRLKIPWLEKVLGRN